MDLSKESRFSVVKIALECSKEALSDVNSKNVVMLLKENKSWTTLPIRLN